MFSPLQLAGPDFLTIELANYITVVAVVAGVLFIAFMVFIALTPFLPSTWSRRFSDVSLKGKAGIEANATAQESD